jgi:hypothetical protein
MATHSDIHTPPATTPALHVLAISGSTRAGSLSAQLLRAAASALPPSIELVELDSAVIKAIPAFDEDDEARAGGDDIPALRTMRDQIDGPTPSCSPPRSTTHRSPARSRTPSTGSPADRRQCPAQQTGRRRRRLDRALLRRLGPRRTAEDPPDHRRQSRRPRTGTRASPPAVRRARFTALSRPA